MKKKKLYLTAFLLVLALALQGGIFSGFSVPVQAAATSKKQTGFVKKNGSWYYYDKNGNISKYKDTEITYSLLNEADQMSFSEGIMVKTKDALMELLQDFES